MMVNFTNTVNYSKNFTFGIEDYIVFGLMLAISVGIGIYFGFFSEKNNTVEEYLLGGKRMKTWPIAISLVASQLSGISVIAIPAEMYSYGVTYAFIVSSMIFVVPILCYVVFPVFYKNNISNCYEYLQLRFNKETRKIVTLAYMLTVFLYLPVFIFIPSLAFSQVTGNNVHVINGIVCSICVFYTMLGGIKAVVWTDVIQGGIMVGSIILVGAIGIRKVGGFDKVVENAIDGGRLHVNFDLDPRTRATVWNCFFGGLCLWLGNIGLNQTCVQRIVALPSIGLARRSLAISGTGFFFIMLFNCLTGIIMYAMYHNCDPLQLKIVDKSDKMMPFFIQDIAGHLKGMPGVFISCVFSAALSTISANLNSLSGVFYLDYVKPFIKHTEQRANLTMKAFVLFCGFYCVLGGFIVEQSKSIIQTVSTIGGMTQGSIVGVFFLGLLVPKAHGKAALTGLISSMIAILCVIVGAQSNIKDGKLSYAPLATRFDDCDRLNYTLHNSISKENIREMPLRQDIELSIFDISFHWYKFTGAVLVWVVAIPLSYWIPESKKTDPNLLSPFMRTYVTRKLRSREEIELNS